LWGFVLFVGVMLQYGALPTNYPDPDPGLTTKTSAFAI